MNWPHCFIPDSEQFSYILPLKKNAREVQESPSCLLSFRDGLIFLDIKKALCWIFSGTYG